MSEPRPVPYMELEERLHRALIKAENEQSDLEAKRRECEARFDCHGGPGCGTPACGGCVTCLLREMEGLQAKLEAVTRERDVFKQYDEACDAEMEEARSYIPDKFFSNDGWQFAVKRMSGHLADMEKQNASLAALCEKAYTEGLINARKRYGGMPDIPWKHTETAAQLAGKGAV